MASKDNLALRQHKRIECCLDAEAYISEEHSNQVVLSGSCLDGRGALPVKIVDCSSGGLGLHSEVLLPSLCMLNVRLINPDLHDEGAGNDTLLDTVLRVHRVMMCDRKPTYYLGTAFADTRPNKDEQIEKLLAFALSRETEASNG